MADLIAEHIKKTYHRGKKVVLNDVSFTADTGECIGILGANGCGKSTLLSILAGVTRADQGTFLLNGKPLLSHSKKHTENVGYIPQDNPLIEELSAWDNLRLWYCNGSLNLEHELQNGILALLGIPDFLHVRVNQMSGGMKKRLSIGCAVAKDPALILLDEPGAALDLPCKEQIGTYLDAQKRRGKILVIATHEEREINLCDKLYILKDSTLTEFNYDGNIHHLAGAL